MKGRGTAPTKLVAVGLLTFVGLGLALAQGACISERPFVWITDLPLPPEEPLVVGPRDAIFVLVRNQATMSGEFVVREDGTYLQPTLGNIPVAGREPSAIAAELQTRLQGIVTDPQVTVTIVKPAPARVSVVGEVKTPGSYELFRDRGVVSALALAGWLTDFARRDRVFVVRPVPGVAAAPGAPARPHTDQRIRFSTTELVAAEPHAARFRLRDGDIVVVE
jgi:polysaccharide export outer membrane protein